MKKHIKVINSSAKQADSKTQPKLAPQTKSSLAAQEASIKKVLARDPGCGRIQ